MSAGHTQYGYLALQRVHGGIATMPDGDKQYFESYEAAATAHQEWITENRLGEEKAKVAEERREFIEGCKVEEERIKQPGMLSPDLIKKKVLGPEGEILGDPTQQEFDTIVDLAASQRFPEPNAFGLGQTLDGGVEKIVVWAASLYLDGEPKQLPAFSSWDFGLPIEGVLAVLNQIATDGWRVVHVSEDRGVYAGITNRTDASVTKARYLLARGA